MFTYVCLGTNRPQRSVPFYDAVMAALGHRCCDTGSEPDGSGWYGSGIYTDDGAREIALWLCPPFNGQPATAGNGALVAFQARRWQQVDGFHAAGSVMAALVKARLGCGGNTARIFTPPTSATPKATNWPLSAAASRRCKRIDSPKRRRLSRNRFQRSMRSGGAWGLVHRAAVRRGGHRPQCQAAPSRVSPLGGQRPVKRWSAGPQRSGAGPPQAGSAPSGGSDP